IMRNTIYALNTIYPLPSKSFGFVWFLLKGAITSNFSKISSSIQLTNIEVQKGTSLLLNMMIDFNG
ncbi:hypothetical protein ACJX0J_029675, partial [Zea mays]